MFIKGRWFWSIYCLIRFRLQLTLLLFYIGSVTIKTNRQEMSNKRVIDWRSQISYASSLIDENNFLSPNSEYRGNAVSQRRKLCLKQYLKIDVGLLIGDIISFLQLKRFIVSSAQVACRKSCFSILTKTINNNVGNLFTLSR
jgi:GTP-dependent phosphoenolpyruvate carboxykinase